jgi:hypothetical protein
MDFKMKKSITSIFSLCLISGLLVACGGGGSGDNVSSSGNSGNSGNSGSGTQAITESCSTPDSGKTYLVSTSGCLIKTSSTTQTGVCTSTTTIKLLTGTGLTKDKVISEGTSFSAGSNLSINGVSYKCV